MHNEFPISHEVLEDPEFKKLPASAKCLYSYCCKNSNRYGRKKEWFWRSEMTLSRDSGLGLSTVKVSKKSLLKKHYIEMAKGRFTDQSRIAPYYYRVRPYKEIVALRNKETADGVENNLGDSQKIHHHRPENTLIIKKDIKKEH